MSALESEILRIAEGAISKSILETLSGYGGAMRKLTESVVEAHTPALSKLINEECAELIGSKDFRRELRDSMNAKLARLLIDRIGGELEKRVNDLKANPETRAKITLAIQKVITEL